MKVLYDGAIYGIQATGGVNKYIARLIDLSPDDVKPFLTTNVRRSVNYPTNPRLRTFYFKRFGFRPGRLCFWLEQRYFRRVMLGRNYDVFHPSLYAENAAQVPLEAFRCPIIVTVHDMIDEIYPEVDPAGIRRGQKLECFHRAKALICVSHNTRADLLKLHPELEHKVHVIHNGCEIDTSSTCCREGIPRMPYFLFVGGRRSTYKNFLRLLDAFQHICKDVVSIQLVIVGMALTSGELQYIGELGLTQRVVLYEDPSEAILARLYRWSLALVYPSLYEGFGIPPLEAMTCGTCVIAADRSSIPEVVGDAALLFEPSDPDGLVRAMSEIIENPSRRADLIAKGAQRIQMFSWQNTVKMTHAVYQSVC